MLVKLMGSIGYTDEKCNMNDKYMVYVLNIPAISMIYDHVLYMTWIYQVNILCEISVQVTLPDRPRIC